MDGQILDQSVRGPLALTDHADLNQPTLVTRNSELEQSHSRSNHRESKASDPRIRELERQLANGQIPDELTENLHVVDLNSTPSIDFHSTILELAKRLFPEHDFEKSPIRFFLMDEEQANACHLKGSNPTLIGLTRSLFDPANDCSVKSLDELAFILAHEWTHRSLEKELGPGRNSKGEEGLADARAVEILFKAGLNPEAALEYSRRVAEYEKKQSKLWPAPDREFWKLVDVHPLDTTRISIIEAALTKLERDKGSIKRSSTELSPEIFQNIEPARHESHLAQYLKSSGYSQASKVEKLAILAEYIASNDNWFEARQADLATQFKSIRIDPQILEERQALDKLADSILNLTTNDTQCPAYLYSISTIISPESNHITKPLGRLRGIAEAVAAFVKAKDSDVIFQSATNLIRLLEDEPAVAHESGRYLLGTLNWPGFLLQRKVGAALPWKAHVNVLSSSRAKDTTQIIKALLILGIDEPFLYKQANLNYLVDAKLQTEICLCPDLQRTLKNVVVEIFDGTLSMVPERNKLGMHDINAETKALILHKHIDNLFLQVKTSTNPEMALAKIQKAILVMQGSGLNAGLRSSLTGIEYIALQTKLVCDINRAAISSSDQAQINLISYLQDNHSADLPENRELLREIMGFGESAGIIDFRVLIQDVAKQKNIKNPILDYIAKLPESVVEDAEKLAYFCSNTFPMETGSHLLQSEEYEDQMNRQEDAFARTRYYQIIRPIAERVLRDFPPERNKSWKSLTVAIESNRDWIQEHPAGYQIANIFIREAGALLQKKPAPGIAQVHEFLCALNTVQNLAAHAELELSAAFREQLSDKPKRWSSHLEVATDQWLTLVKHLMLDEVESFDALKQLVKRIQQSDSPTTQMKAAGTLLASKRIIDPDIRETLLNMWSDACARRLGNDDLSDSYQRNLAEIVGRVSKSFSAVDRREALDLLGKKTLAQEEATRLLETGLPKMTRSALENSQLFGVAAEGMLNMLRKDFSMRMGLVDFLTSPYSTTSTLAFVESVLYYTESTDKLDYAGSDSADEANLVGADGLKTLSPYAELKSRRIYENFWSAPFEARTLFIREFLLPPDTPQAEVDQAFDYILDRTLPSTYQHAEPARRLLRAYINVIPDYEKHIAMAALLVASEKSASSKHRVGAALATFLETMGPAETKAGQAAQSHPETPLDIRGDLKRLKTMASEPTRWELYQLIRDNVPEPVRTQIQHVGKVLGSASFFIAARVTMKDGSPKVLRLLRPSALARAENGFEYLSKMVGELGPDDATFQTLRELIDEAIVTARIETNIRRGVDQNEAAEMIYNGAQVSFAGQSFEFKVPRLSAFDNKYMLLDEAPGEHFLDLPEGTAEQFSYKRNVAKAIASFELHRIFSGRYFDKDRHGGNCRVSGNTISHFDFGALEMSEPTDSELKQLANILFDSLTQAASEREFTDNYFQNLKKLRAEEGIVPHYLCGIQKALLSLGELNTAPI